MGLDGRERTDREEEGQKGQSEGWKLQGHLVCCDDLANSVLPCLNTENSNLPAAISMCLTTYHFQPLHTLPLYLYPHTHTHLYTTMHMPYVFISRWRQERSHVWQTEKEKYLYIHAETTLCPLPHLPLRLSSLLLCMSGFLSLATLFVAHWYFSADGVHGNREVSL